MLLSQSTIFQSYVWRHIDVKVVEEVLACCRVPWPKIGGVLQGTPPSTDMGSHNSRSYRETEPLRRWVEFTNLHLRHARLFIKALTKNNGHFHCVTVATPMAFKQNKDMWIFAEVELKHALGTYLANTCIPTLHAIVKKRQNTFEQNSYSM